MEGPKKQVDTPNSLWILAFTLMGGAFIYASFVALQALYMADAEELEMKREAEGKRAAVTALNNKQAITAYKKVTDAEGKVRYVMPLTAAMDQVLTQVRTGNAATLIPAIGTSDKPTVPAVYGRPPDNVQMPKPAPVLEIPGDGSVPAPPEGGEGPAAGTPAAGTPAAGTGQAPPEGAEGPAAGTGAATPTPGTGAATPTPTTTPAAGTPKPGAPKPGTGAPAPRGAAKPATPKPAAPKPAAAKPAAPKPAPAGGNATP